MTKKVLVANSTTIEECYKQLWWTDMHPTKDLQVGIITDMFMGQFSFLI